MSDTETLGVTDDRWFGGDVDLVIWRSLLVAGNDSLSHELWCAVIRAIAVAVLKHREIPSDGDETKPDDLVSEWHSSAMPDDADLMWAIGDYSDYFQGQGFGWNEHICLSGDACPFHEVVWDLHGKLAERPDALEAVTEESVELFYCDWRTRILRRVLQEAESLKAADSNSSSDESHLE